MFSLCSPPLIFSIGPGGGDRGLNPFSERRPGTSRSAISLGLFLSGRLVFVLASAGGDRGGLGRGAVGHLLRSAAGMVLAEVLVENGLEGEALAAHVAMEGLVARVLSDVVLELVLAGVFFAADAAHEGGDAHVQPHVPV